jgi:hypothetical protein
MLNIHGGIINIYFYPEERGLSGDSFLIRKIFLTY